MITADDLEWMIETENECLGSTAVLYSPSYTAGALGNTVQTWVNAGTINCDVWPIDSSEQSSGNQEIAKAQFYISVPYNTDVNVEDRLIISNVTYEVTFVPISQTWATNKRLEARNYNGV